MRRFVMLARIGRPHGVAGVLHVDLCGSHLRELVGEELGIARTDHIAPVYDDIHLTRKVILQRAEPIKGDVARVAFEGLADRDEAAKLTNSILVLPLETLLAYARAKHGAHAVPFADLWYFEMHGLSVLDAHTGDTLGTIAAVEEHGRNTVVTIAPGPGSSVLGQAIDVPLEYPHWGKADLDRRTVSLAEWQHFAES